MVALASCQTYGEDPNYTMTITGEYRALADCWYLKVANPRGYIKTDLTSIRTVRVTMGSDSWTTARVDFVETSPGTTEVRGAIGVAAAGSYWRSIERDVRQCAGTAP